MKGPQFKSGQAVLKYYTQIKGNYLFYSVLFDKNGTLLDGTLGKSASHGCVRLALENAKYIYDNAPIGSGIWIK
ncbi:L,D-transpeptidase family protein [Clostridium pasteurianum]|uniref:L,D-transpeptidase family protein n=1 Tax=Clostridium pasteurianum TaxID=1501 RepID=UPI00325BACD5